MGIKFSILAIWIAAFLTVIACEQPSAGAIQSLPTPTETRPGDPRQLEVLILTIAK